MSKRFSVLLFVLAIAGCQERQPRSFVQPNVIRKADLDGVWYYAQTVTDAPPTSGAAWVGLSSDLMKIKFDVQEDYVYARRAYAMVEGLEDAEHRGGEYLGQPLAVWRVKSQFDIIRDYNATTGEETNRIIESQERPWNEREFIRVDWSENLAASYDGFGFGNLFEGVTMRSYAWWESDPSKPDSFHMERATAEDAADGELKENEASYFDITNKVVIEGAAMKFDWGKRSLCSLTSYGLPNLEDCAAQVVNVRHAFAKRSPAHDYQVRKWDGRQMDMFGLFDQGQRRFSYNRQYGVTNSGIQRYAARFNLWKRSYRVDDSGEKVAIPYWEREQRTIPYYATATAGEFPPDLFEVGRDVVRQWNEAVKVAVKDASCERAGGEGPLVCHKSLDEVKDVFVWCHNPVHVGEDPEACAKGLQPELGPDGAPHLVDGKPVLFARRGDPRRSHIVWIGQGAEAGLLGYGPGLNDPETGETISGQTNIYGAMVDTYAAYARDLVLLITGRIPALSYVDGLDVNAWVEANRGGSSGRSAVVAPDQLRAHYKAMDFGFAKGLASFVPLDRSSPKAFEESARARAAAVHDSGVFGLSNANLGQAQLDRLRDSLIEAQLVTPDAMAAAGLPRETEFTALSAADKARVSPLRSVAVQTAMRELQEKMSAFGVDFAEFADEGITQRAIKLANDPLVNDLDPDAILALLRKELFRATTLHEMGHNLGLRHNFRGSYDALNYFPTYWQLRDAGLHSTQGRYAGLDKATLKPIGTPYGGGAACTSGPHAGELRPRYIDCPGGAVSVEEATGGVHEYQYSSIMDYGSDFNTDLQGLGHYDKAAMKFSYAGDGFVEVFKSAKGNFDLAKPDEATLRFTSMQYSLGWGYASPLYLFSGPNEPISTINYTSYPGLFTDGIAGLEAREDVPFSEIDLSAVLKLDHENRAMVPYQFCSDEFAGNMTCQRFDSGADVYEQATDLISRYHNHYLINNFKRDRYEFSDWGYTQRIYRRYFDMIRTELVWYTLLRTEWDDQLGIDAFFQDEAGWGPFTEAVTQGFSLLGRVLATPEAGQFAKVPAGSSVDVPVDEAWRKVSDRTTDRNGAPLKQDVIGILDGKYSQTTWDFDRCGYYWAEECQSRIGYFYDKIVALQTLAESQAYFTGRDTSTDLRKYAIGYIVPFKHQIQEKLGALLSGDLASFAPHFTDDKHTQVSTPDWALNDGTMQPRSDLIDPATGFTLQLYAGVLGLAYFPTTFDASFIDTTRVFIVGNGEAPVSDAILLGNGPLVTEDPDAVVGAGGSAEWLRWTDPDTGKTYAAHSTAKVSDGGGDAPSYRNDTGVRMLTTVKRLYDQIDPSCNSTCAGKRLVAQKFKQNIDVMRSLHKQFGYTPYL